MKHFLNLLYPGAFVLRFSLRLHFHETPVETWEFPLETWEFPMTSPALTVWPLLVKASGGNGNVSQAWKRSHPQRPKSHHCDLK